MTDSIRMFSTLALKGAMSRLAEGYQSSFRARIDADFAPTLALLERVRAGEGVDLVILDSGRARRTGKRGPRRAVKLRTAGEVVRRDRR